MLKKGLPALLGGIGLVLVLVALPLMGACTPKEVTSLTREFTIDGVDFEFSPASITVNQGDRVKITFRNVGAFPHDFRIDELGVKILEISSDETAILEFTADISGTFAFYCSVPAEFGTHRDLGMEGVIIVE